MNHDPDYVANTTKLNTLFELESMLDEVASRTEEIIWKMQTASSREMPRLVEQLVAYNQMNADIARLLLDQVEDDEIEYADQIRDVFNMLALDLDKLVESYRAGDLDGMKLLLQKAQKERKKWPREAVDSNLGLESHGETPQLFGRHSGDPEGEDDGNS